jgi:hypothetical protein
MTTITTEITLTEQQEDRYITFCDRHDLDVMFTVEKQFEYLELTDQPFLFSALRGIVMPKAKKKSIIFKSKQFIENLIEVVVDMSSVPNFMVCSAPKRVPMAQSAPIKVPSLSGMLQWELPL